MTLGILLPSLPKQALLGVKRIRLSRIMTLSFHHFYAYLPEVNIKKKIRPCTVSFSHSNTERSPLRSLLASAPCCTSSRTSPISRECCFLAAKRSGMKTVLRYNPRAATKEEIMGSGVTVASLFFRKIFGVNAQKALSVFVALR